MVFLRPPATQTTTSRTPGVGDSLRKRRRSGARSAGRRGRTKRIKKKKTKNKISISRLRTLDDDVFVFCFLPPADLGERERARTPENARAHTSRRFEDLVVGVGVEAWIYNVSIYPSDARGGGAITRAPADRPSARGFAIVRHDVRDDNNRAVR